MLDPRITRGSLTCLALAAWLVTGCDSSSTPGAGDGGTTDGQQQADGAPAADGAPPADTGVGPDGAVPDGAVPDGAVPDQASPPADGAPPADTGVGPDAAPPPEDGAVVDAAPADGPVVATDLPLPPSDGALADVVVFDAAPPPPGCGNGTREGTEECDDGNTQNLDGCSSGCLFEQLQRVNYLQVESGTDAICGQNAFGGAITNALALDQIQASIDAGIQDGSMTMIMQFLGLDDLTGQDDPLLVLGMLAGAPAAGATYDGSADLDWWYDVTASGLDGDRVPLVQVNGGIAAGTLTAGPAEFSFPLDLGGGAGPSLLKISHGKITAGINAASKPTASAGGTPGHEASESVDPALETFESMGSQTGTSSGRLCGNVSAASLAAVPMPAALTGLISCQEGYTTANSLLDLMVGGCSIMIVGQVIAPTQPDTHDPMLPSVGAGPPYALSLDGAKKVAGCKDKDGTTIDLALCLQDAAFSVFFRFAASRVIGK